jgi:hypothetical protein
VWLFHMPVQVRKHALRLSIPGNSSVAGKNGLTVAWYAYVHRGGGSENMFLTRVYAHVAFSA